ncbi:YndJ family protein [Streptomyces sp. NPDC059788]|uniref:YndJ family protein n=1 Tax=Streptomyces sp. NPDC059788 TaxID=3346948 RepID=UPI003649E934
MTALVDLIVMLGMFVVVPTGLALIGDPAPEWLRRRWPVAAAAGAASLWLPRGAAATALATGYALATLALALHAPRRLARTRSLAPDEIAVLTALATPAVAGTALVAERSGHRLFGFDLEILSLTVPHLHFAGFAAALVAGLVCRAARPGRAGPLAALSVPVGTLLVLAGYFVDDWAELAGAVVLTGGMWLVALITWRDVRTAAPDRTTRALLAVSAAVLVATMLLALSWALGEATGLPHPTLAWMAATHGLGNALGFALCALLAWRRLRDKLASTPTSTSIPTPTSEEAGTPA